MYLPSPTRIHIFCGSLALIASMSSDYLPLISAGIGCYAVEDQFFFTQFKV